MPYAINGDSWRYIKSVGDVLPGETYTEEEQASTDPDEAFLEAMLETGKAKGEPKSLDLISRSALKALERSREEIAVLKQEIKTMADEIKDLKKKIK